MSENGKKKKKLNMKALSMLDSIIERDNESIFDEDTSSNSDDVSLPDLDDVSINSEEVKDPEPEESTDDTSLESMNKMLDNILISSKVSDSSDAGSKSKPSILKAKTNTIHTELARSSELKNTHPLIPNEIIYTMNNQPIKVLRLVSSFEVFMTYIVEFMGKHYLLRWYFKDNSSDLKGLRERFEKAVSDPSTPKYYLKPKVITKPKDGGFGCIYTDITHDYYTLKDIINSYIIECDTEDTPTRKSIKFKNLQSMIGACINIIKVFNDFNQSKSHIYAFSDENMFININTGEVFIDALTSISDGKSYTLDVDTQCTYLAPELLDGTHNPNPYTDMYTLAVILFRILFHDHPLEGKAIIDDVSSAINQNMDYYSNKAVFIFNPNNTSNKAVRGVNYTSLSMWNKYPVYLRDIFIDAFCKHIFSPKERYTTQDWIKCFLHLKCDILPCICGRTDFSFLYEYTQQAFYKCQRCGSKYHSLYFVKRNFDIPIYTGNQIYTTFLKDNINNVEEVMGLVIENKINTNLNGIKNVGSLEWKCTSSNGTTKTVNKDTVIPIFEGTVIDVGGSIAQFDFINSRRVN